MTFTLVKLSAGRVGLGQTFKRQDWEDWGIGQSCCVGVGRIGQTFCGSGQDWSRFLWEWTGLVKYCVGVDRIGKTLCGRGQDW